MSLRLVFCTCAIFILLGAGSTALAEVPDSINFQGILLDSGGDPVSDPATVTFTIYNDVFGGTILWDETKSIIPDDQGRFQTFLGSQDPLDETVFAVSLTFIEVTVSGDPPMPRVPLVTVPYAYHAVTVDGGGSRWEDFDSILYTNEFWGIARGGADNALYGDQHHTMVNLGIACTTGTNGQNYTNATIGGGYGNKATNFGTTVAGGDYNIAGDNWTTVAGGTHNTAGGEYASIGGGVNNNAGGIQSTISGGVDNTTGDDYATVGGGILNFAEGQSSTIAGGANCRATGRKATVGGGGLNLARGDFSVVAGGGNNYWPDSNSALGVCSAILGGRHNVAADDYSTIGGGRYNRAGGDYSVVAGGGGPNDADSNSASGYCSAIVGGRGNVAAGGTSAIGGGQVNTASGGYSAIGGGISNEAGNNYTAVPGGYGNAARGQMSFAAGNQAKANHDGSIVISAHSSTALGDSIGTGKAGQMVLRADGELYITNTGGAAPFTSGRLINTSSGAYLTTTGTWTNSSDRNLKENFVTVSTDELLDKIARLAITRWNYKGDSDEITHIGPVAQDFQALFGVGQDNTSIPTIDADGIALGAIQGLYRQTQVQQQENDELKKRVAELEALVQRLIEDKE